MPENTPHLALQGFLVWMSLIVAIGPQNALVIRQGLLRRSVGAVIAVCMAGDVALVFGGTAGVGVLVDRAPVVLTVLRWVGVAFLLWFASTAVRDAVRPSGMTAGDEGGAGSGAGDAAGSGAGQGHGEGDDGPLPGRARLEPLPPTRADGAVTVAARPVADGGVDGVAHAAAADLTHPAAADLTHPAEADAAAEVAPGDRTGRTVSRVRRTLARVPRPVVVALAMTWLNPGSYIDGFVMFGGIANQQGADARWVVASGAMLATLVWFPVIGYGAAALSGPLSRPGVWRAINIVIAAVMVAMAVRLATGH
ncbi:LysE family transporter [Corynebacterium bovis]|uniref:LysE/ArgO family amino acid transporter n=1 Tax=Corynebacterium bovis TaxID=36808 RepID=UPI0024469A64|nr:LysE family transporter [Corynebacterium bovis]MDH2455253.1 LysE family transporter [Corynebacterium bovis]